MNHTLLKKFLVIIVIIFIYCFLYKKIYYHLENKSELFYDKVIFKKKSKIYDIVHENLPSMRNILFIVDIIPFFLLAIICFIDLKLFYNVLGFLIPIYFIRLIIIHLTILPKDKKCDIENDSSILTGGCYDKIYSGHFASIFISLLVLYKRNYINMFLFIFILLISGLLIITARSHYTIDIFVSFLIVILFYQNNINACRIIDIFFN